MDRRDSSNKIIGSAMLAAGVLAAFGAMAAETVTYTYDVHGRVVKVEHSGGGPNADTKIEYEYDKADNREEVKTTNSPNAPPP